jgi:VWFA-related protein
MRCTHLVVATLICTLASAADRLNRLNVVALDPHGQPVTGLQSADLQLWEDGKPRKIVFSRFTADKPLKPTSLGPGEYSNRASAALRATVIVIDLLSDRMMSGSVIDQDIEHSLKNLESSENVYLYFLTYRGELYPVHPLPKPDAEVTPAGEPWTRNIAPLLQAGLKNLFGIKPVDDRDIKVRFELTVNALRDLGAQMRQVSGRKNLIWVTHGIPIYGFSISTQARMDFTYPLRQVCQELEQAQVVVYPVEQSMRGAGAAMGTESEQALQEFADLTGGRRYGSGRVDEALQQAMTDFRANYQIAYYSASAKPDGKRHKLRVTCARKEVRLQTEPGFYAVASLNPPDDVERVALEATTHSPFDATEIGLRAGVSPDSGAKGNMRLEIRIEAADLLLRQAQDRRTGNISLWFVAYQAAGWGQPGPPIPLNISLTPEQYETVMHDGIELHRALPAGTAIRKVRAIVVDRELGTVGSITIPIQP